MPGRIPLESLAGIAWNPWPESNGITGRDHVESVAGIVWNLHLGLPDEYEHRVHDLRRPFQWEPDYNVTSVNYDFAGLRREKHWREKA